MKDLSVKVGTVTRTTDKSRTGNLWIKPDDEEEGRADSNEIQASMASPCIGGGYGFIHVPGPGSRVLYGSFNEVGELNSPIKYVWFASISFPLLQTTGRNVLANSVTDSSDFNATRIDLDPFPRKEDDGGIRIDGGIPNSNLVYGDNDMPQAAVWKAPPGHFLQFSNKVTKWGTHDVATLLMNASGKFIKMDDGPPTEGMDRITISDETSEYGGNRLEILTGDPAKPNSILAHSKQDQDFISVEGSQIMAITAGEGAQIRENMATGGIHDIAYTADHSIEAETDISRVSHTGNISETAKSGNITVTSEAGFINIDAAQSITFQCGDSTITMTPTSIQVDSPSISINGATVSIVGAAGDAVILGKSLVTHTHGGVKSGDSTTSGPL